MRKEIKNFLLAVAAFFSALFASFFLSGRSKTDRNGSKGDTDRDRECENGFDNIERRVASAEEHLSRAERILREAVEKGKESKQDTDNINF